jgi:hypothetical protein
MTLEDQARVPRSSASRTDSLAAWTSAGRTARPQETRSRRSQLTRRADDASAAATYDAS